MLETCQSLACLEPCRLPQTDSVPGLELDATTHGDSISAAMTQHIPGKRPGKSDLQSLTLNLT